MCWLYQYQTMQTSEQKILPEIKRENLWWWRDQFTKKIEKIYVYMHISLETYEETDKAERKIEKFTIIGRDASSLPETGKH